MPDHKERIGVPASKKPMAVSPMMVAVVIPIYAAELAPEEHMALEQLSRVLGAYPRILIAPASLSIEGITTRYGLTVERFPDQCFRSVADYNRLMLSVEFYERLAKYRYILIHQLDAFVFRDELAFWCNQGFDYIGAPWMARWAFHSPWLDRFKAPRGWFARRFPGRSKRWLRYAIVNQVGNGGLSLRRVQAFLQVLRNPPASLETYREAPLHYYQEDVFWGVAANRWRPRIRTPGWRTALRFAIEGRADAAYEFMDARLPFGCHAWAKLDAEFWRPHVHRALAPP